MSRSIPRWEWRTFGEAFGDADERFAALSRERVEESDEIYLLSIASDASVKVRDGLLDVKLLQAVNDDGLEQWKPVLKAGLPARPRTTSRPCSRRSAWRPRRRAAASTRSSSWSASS